MPKTYRPYDYNYDTPYIGRTSVIENYLDKKFGNISIDKRELRHVIKSSVEESLGDVDCQFCSIHNHIERAKNEIINHEPCNCMDLSNLATKSDIENAIVRINEHTTEKFDELDFDEQFQDLNQLIANMNNH